MARHIDNFGPRPAMPREYIPARRVTPEEIAATASGMPPGVADYDILYWLVATGWHLLSFTADKYKVLQHHDDGTLGYDWVRAH